MPRDSAQLRQSFSNEASLLLGGISRFIGLNTPEQLSVLLRADLNWPRFLQLVRAHRVVGPVLGGFLTTDLRNVPDSELAQLKADHNANARRSLFLTGQLIAVLQLLSSHRIPAISFKGPILSLDAYGDPAIRGSGDLDLLIHRSDMPAAQIFSSKAASRPSSQLPLPPRPLIFSPFPAPASPDT